MHQRWRRPLEQGETEAREPAQEPKDRQEFQAHGYALARRHIREPRRSVSNPKRGPIDLVGILNDGVQDKIADVVARTVRQHVAEGSIPDRHGPREPVSLLQLEPGGVINGRSPPNMDAHGAIPERQP